MALHSHYDYEGLHLMMFVTIITTAHPWEVSCGALLGLNNTLSFKY